MDIGTVHGIYTLIFMFAFIGMAIWVFLPRRKKTYDDAAALPLDDVHAPKRDDASQRQE